MSAFMKDCSSCNYQGQHTDSYDEHKSNHGLPGLESYQCNCCGKINESKMIEDFAKSVIKVTDWSDDLLYFDEAPYLKSKSVGVKPKCKIISAG